MFFDYLKPTNKRIYIFFVILFLSTDLLMPQKTQQAIQEDSPPQYVSYDRKLISQYDTHYYWRHTEEYYPKDIICLQVMGVTWFLERRKSENDNLYDQFYDRGIYYFDNNKKVVNFLGSCYPAELANIKSGLFVYASKILVIGNIYDANIEDPCPAITVINPSRLCVEKKIPMLNYTYCTYVKIMDDKLYVYLQSYHRRFNPIWVFHFLLPVKNAWKWQIVSDSKRYVYVYDKNFTLIRKTEITNSSE